MALDLNAQEARVALQLDPDQLTDEILRQPLDCTRPPAAEIVPGFVPAQHAVDLMRRRRVPAVVICDAHTGRLQGLLTERDILRLLAEGVDLAHTPIEDVMTANPFCHGPWDSIGFALNKMVVDGYRTIPLIDSEGRPVGMITRAHLLRHLTRYLQRPETDDVRRERDRRASRPERGDELGMFNATG